jgi:hypothetical protein
MCPTEKLRHASPAWKPTFGPEEISVARSVKNSGKRSTVEAPLGFGAGRFHQFKNAGIVCEAGQVAPVQKIS